MIAMEIPSREFQVLAEACEGMEDRLLMMGSSRSKV